MEWDLVEEKGNPTKSPQLNTLIKQVARFELRGEGKPGSEKRPLEFQEFMNILKINLEHHHFQNATLHGLWTWTFQLVCRVDDACNLKYEDIKYVNGYPGSLFIEVVRSKNIANRKQATRQLILGSMDPYLCALAGLTAHLIDRLEDRDDPSNLVLEWMFTSNGATGRDDMLRTDYSRSALKRIVALDEFEPMGSVPDIGTHSFRKCPCTYAQRRGSTKDDAEARGRWAMKADGTPRYRKRRQVDTYTSNLMPYPDAKVSEQLCGPRGPCIYKVVQQVENIDNVDFLSGVVPGLYALPNIHESHKRLFAIIALYLATTDSILVDYDFKQHVIQHIHQEFEIPEDADLTGIVAKQQVLVIRDSNDGFRIQEIDGAPGAENVQNMNVQDLHNEIMGLTAEVRHLKQMMEEDKLEYTAQNTRLRKLVQRTKREMAAGFHRLDLPYRARRNAQAQNQQQPNQQQQNQQNQQNQQQHNQQQHNQQPHFNHQQQNEAREARLSKGPKTLWNLWLEYEEGLEYNKAAKNFTPRERGRVKSVYSHRNHFWKAMEKIIARGHSAQNAIEC